MAKIREARPGAPRNSLEEGKNEEGMEKMGWRREGGEGLGFHREFIETGALGRPSDEALGDGR
jgi:hypothetical protein